MKFLASKGFNEKEVAEKIKNNEELKVDEESKLRCRRCICLIWSSIHNKAIENDMNKIWPHYSSGGSGELEGSLVPGR